MKMMSNSMSLTLKSQAEEKGCQSSHPVRKARSSQIRKGTIRRVMKMKYSKKSMSQMIFYDNRVNFDIIKVKYYHKFSTALISV